MAAADDGMQGQRIQAIIQKMMAFAVLDECIQTTGQ